MVWLMIFLFLALSFIETSILVKKKLLKDIPIFLFLMAVALTYSISGVTEWNFPAPGALVEMVFKPLSDLVFPKPAG